MVDRVQGLFEVYLRTGALGLRVPRAYGSRLKPMLRLYMYANK